MKRFLILALAITAIYCEKFHWAVLVSGTRTYPYYHNQADLAHAYQVLIKHGMDPNHIITLSYDDAVNHKDNPIPGKLFNQPDGEDVYQGMPIDYSGEHCNLYNFEYVMCVNILFNPLG